MTRSTQIRAFLDAHHGVGGTITPLAGDASGRQYHRVTTRTDTVLVMDLPATDTATLSSFAKMTAHLSHIGLSPPRIFATDQDQSLMLLEDLGDAVFARLLQANPAAESQIYLRPPMFWRISPARPRQPACRPFTAWRLRKIRRWFWTTTPTATARP